MNVANFPMQWKHPFRKTSEVDGKYNCIAWALGHTWTWYEPRIENYRYRLPKFLTRWPPEVPNEYSQEAYIKFFEYHGFERCSDGRLEHGIEKVAFYYIGLGIDRPHACKQLKDGKWSSKMGNQEDVEHDLQSMEKGRYGEVVQFLKRARLSAEETNRE